MATISSTIELVDKMSDNLTKIQENVDKVKSSLKSIEDEQSTIDNFSWNTFLSNAEHAGQRMAEIGKSMTLAVTAPLLLLGKKMYGNAVDYESAFAGVKKTTDATEEEFAQLYRDLLGITEVTPTGFVDAAGVMEMAGQLGVAKDQLTGFTKAYIDLQQATNIQGEAGAADLARFLNVTQKTTANVQRVGGVIVGLGNNFATTEQEILAMATRMGATADIAGMHVAEILAFSAALSSVGINAEAGGSAAGKLMKRMQLAAEVGGTAQERIAGLGEAMNFESGIDFYNWLQAQKKEDVVGLANDLGITTDAVQDLAKSWVAMDQFAEVMGMDTPEFIKSWQDGPAQSMLSFFQGLGNLDPDTGNSILAQLAEMDLTEIRLSNLIAAMSVNSDLFEQALAEAYRQYTMNPEENAMTVEVNKRYETQESQNAMLGNKLNNTMAEFGQNLVDALNPALEVVNDTLDRFNQLSEMDQTNLLKTLGVIAVLGPGLTVAGKAIEVTSKAIQGFKKFKDWGGLEKGLSAIAEFAIGTPAGNVLLLAGGVTALALALDSMPSDLDRILEGAANIPITIDEAQYQETLEQIETVQAALNGLKAGEINERYEKTSLSVEMGLGTNEMFGTALAYEAEKANAAINEVSSGYAAQIADLQKQMEDATWVGNMDLANQLSEQIDAVRAEADNAIRGLQDDYTEKISTLYSGMASKFPEEAKVLEDAAKRYDLALMLNQFLDNSKTPSAEIAATDAWIEFQAKEPEIAADTDFNAWFDDFYNTYESQLNEKRAEMAAMLSDLGYGENIDFSHMTDANWRDYYTAVIDDMESALQTVSDNPILSTWLASLIGNDKLTENLDPTALNGALEGIVKMLDFQNALKEAEANGDKYALYGKYVVEGLAGGIQDNADLVAAPFATVRDNILEALRSELGIASPSTVMQAEGVWIPAGLALGITDGAGIVAGAMAATGTTAIVVIASILNENNGEAIAADFMAGIVEGLTLGRIKVETPELQFDPFQIELPEIPEFSVNIPEMDDIHIESPEINPINVNLPEIQPIQIASPETNPVNIQAPEFEKMLIDLPNVDFSDLAVDADFSAFEDEAYQAGANLSTQYGAGIQGAMGGAVAAIVALGAVITASVMGSSAMAVQAANGIMNFSAGFGIGGNLASGMAAGVNSGAGAVAAAVARMVQNALAAGNAAAQIHSPSRLTYWAGDMMVQGYINAIRDGESGLMAAVSDLTGNTAEIWVDPIQTNLQFSIDPVAQGMERSLQAAESAMDGTMGALVSYAEKAWNEAAWGDIAYFAALEHDQLLSDAEDSIKISEADIRKIRQLAEREVINQFTTAEIKVQMNNNNTIKSDMDLDGIADYLADVVQEKLEAAAEGVYK
jgi:TP901 family phage tail tape measure protein